MRALFMLLLAVLMLHSGCGQEPERSLPLGGSALWVAGHKCSGSEVHLSVQMGALRIQCGTCTFDVQRLPTEEDVLSTRMMAAYNAEGLQAALEEARRSKVVQSAELGEGKEILVTFRKWRSPIHYFMNVRREAHGKSKQQILEMVDRTLMKDRNDTAQRLKADIESHLRAAPSSGLLIVVGSKGEAAYFANDSRQLAEAQLEKLATGSQPNVFPAGPIEPGTWIALEAIMASSR